MTARASPRVGGMNLSDAIFGLSPHIRYVAIASSTELELAERPGLADASAAESDRYEEILVNPTLLGLARRRGDIDCGGLRYLVVRYGNFFQLVIEHQDGHVSVAIDPEGDPVSIVEQIRSDVLEA